MTTGLFIGGAWRTGQPLDVTNKYTGEVIGSVATAAPPDVDAAIVSAARGAAAMAAMPTHRRCDILLRTAALLNERKEAIARTIAAEAGKPVKLARVEVDRGATTYQLAGEEARRIHGETLAVDAVPSGEGFIGFWWRRAGPEDRQPVSRDPDAAVQLGDDAVPRPHARREEPGRGRREVQGAGAAHPVPDARADRAADRRPRRRRTTPGDGRDARLRRPFLRQMGIDTADDLNARLGALWQYLAGEWFTLRLPDNANVTRGTVHPWWAAVHETWRSFGPAAEISRQFRRGTGQPVQWHVRHMAGCVESFAARTGITTPEAAMEAITEALMTVWESRDFNAKVTEKSIALGIVTAGNEGVARVA